MCFGSEGGNGAYNGTLIGHGNWDLNHPENMGNTAPSFRDIQTGAFDWANPGQIDLHQTNPEYAKLLDHMNSYLGSRSSMGIDAQNRAYAQAMNQAASMGLAGSAAGYGGANEAMRQTGLGWDQQSIQLAQMIGQGTLAGQKQYSDFQQQAYGGYLSQSAGASHAYDQYMEQIGSTISGAMGGGSKVGAAAAAAG